MRYDLAQWEYYEPLFEYENVINPLNTAWHGHVFFAYDLVRNIRPDCVVELGTHYGHSFFSFCQAVKDAKQKTKLVAVDTWEGDKHAGFYGPEVYETVKKIQNEIYPGIDIELLKEAFDEAAGRFEEKSIALLHIDGLHTYEAVKHDLATWMPKVKDDGVILLHDTEVKRGDFGVYRLLEELKKDYSTLEFYHCEGLGVIFKEKNDNLAHFERVFQKYYALFSKQKILGIDAKNKDAHIKNIERSQEKLKKSIDNLTEQNATLITESNRLNEERNRIHEKIKQQEEAQAKLKEQAAKAERDASLLREEKRQIQKDLQEKEKKIKEELKKEITTREKALKNEKIERKNEKEKAEQKYSELHDDYHELEEALTRKEHHIQNIEPSFRRFKQLKKSLPFRMLLGTYDALYLIKTGLSVLRTEGIKSCFEKTKSYFGRNKTKGKQKSRRSPHEQYQIFLSKNRKSKSDIKKLKKNARELEYRPKISVITPVYNVEPAWLNKCIQSLLEQYYDNWELCLHDDASTSRKTIDCLKKWQKTDKRIKVSFGESNQHISGASNEAIKQTTGEFVGFLDNDDELTPDALYEVAKALNKNKSLDFIYSDEDKLEMDGTRTDPYFKSDFNPDLLLSNNYICHFAVVRKNLGDTIGWFRKGYEGSQDYDLFLRLTEKTKNIYHIPKILYHWRKIPGSTAAEYSEKSYPISTSIKALSDYLKRNNIKGAVGKGLWQGSFRVKRDIEKEELVSIIIPFRDKVKLLKKCVESIYKKTHYKNFEIILISNNSKERRTFTYTKKLVETHKNISFFECNIPFNYSRINNWAVEKAKGKYILLLNNDVEVISEGWLTAMVEHIQRPEVGAVGAKLLYPDKTVQHAGVVLGVGGIANHAFYHNQDFENGYFGNANVIRDCSACTGACLLTKKELFQEVKGLNEKQLQVAFNDVDYCLKIRDKGYLIIYTPYAKLYHYESVSRGHEDTSEKQERFKKECEFIYKKWGTLLKNDPYYNPNLSLTGEGFDINI